MESVENIKLTEKKTKEKLLPHKDKKKIVKSGRALRALESFLFKLQMFRSFFLWFSSLFINFVYFVFHTIIFYEVFPFFIPLKIPQTNKMDHKQTNNGKVCVYFFFIGAFTKWEGSYFVNQHHFSKHRHICQCFFLSTIKLSFMYFIQLKCTSFPFYFKVKENNKENK